MICSVCGGTSFNDRTIIWDDLASEWQLSPGERAYIDRQQGTACSACGANLRSIALADALLSALKANSSLIAFAKTEAAKPLKILEINEAGSLGPTMRLFQGHVLASYPDIDIHALPYADESFDVVIHSDTLEHVQNPVHALRECRRVLRQNGTLCFTVPTIVGRLSRGRAGLPKSFHGNADTGSDDFMVQTEFGADMWSFVIEAGFTAVTIHTVDYPSALALSAAR